MKKGAAMLLVAILISATSSVLGQLDLGPSNSNQLGEAARQSTLIQPGYLPPIEGAGAQNDLVVVTTPSPPGPTHHGRNLCTDPFHSFLCSPLKPRKPFTGSPVQNFLGANSFVAPSKVLAPPLNDIYEPPVTQQPPTTRRPPPPSTTTRRPPPPSTTTRRPPPPSTTTRRPPPPPTTTTTTTEKPVEPAPSSDVRTYLPPDLPESIAPAAASQDIAIAPPDNEVHDHDHHHHHPHHHGRDLCSDPFHAFLCQPLKPRKRITGNLPNSFQGQHTFLVPQRAEPEPLISPEPSNEVDRIYLPPSTTTTRRPTTAVPTTQIRFRPEPSNEVDRIYLPPTTTTRRPTTIRPTTAAPTTQIRFRPEPSNEVDRLYLPPVTTTRRFITTQRPTTAFRFRPEPSNEIIYVAPSTTTRRPTTARPLPTTTARQFQPEPSNEIERAYLPPTTTTRRPTTLPSTTPFRFRPQPSNVFQRVVAQAQTTPAPAYLPPVVPQSSNVDLQVQPAPTQNNPNIIAPDDHHHHHHHKDICSDPFHSFLCSSLKPRIRITGALPPGTRADASNVQETTILKHSSNNLNIIVVPPLPPSTTTTTTTTTPRPIVPAPSEPLEVPILPAPSNDNPVIGYNYPKPQKPLPLPNQGYDYPKPQNPFPSPSKGYDYPQPEVKLTLPSEIKPVIGYDYPKPSSQLPLPTTGYNYPKPSTQLPLPTKGYDYPKPEKRLPLPSENNPVLGYDYPKPSTQLPTTGYDYPKPTKGYNYPTPQNELPLPAKPYRTKSESRQLAKTSTKVQQQFRLSQKTETGPQKTTKETANLPANLAEARQRLRNVANIGTQNTSSDLILVNDVDFPADGGLPVRFGERLKRRQPRRELPQPYQWQP